MDRGTASRAPGPGASGAEPSHRRAPFNPMPIPGVRIAYVGDRAQSISGMRVYWQTRRATIFIHLCSRRQQATDAIEPHCQLRRRRRSCPRHRPQTRRCLMAFFGSPACKLLGGASGTRSRVVARPGASALRLAVPASSRDHADPAGTRLCCADQAGARASRLPDPLHNLVGALARARDQQAARRLGVREEMALPLWTVRR